MPSASARRSVELRGEIDEDVAVRTIAQLLFFEDQHAEKPITLWVTSPGGVVGSSLSIIDTMGTLRCPIYTHADGHAKGTAALIVASGRQGHRTATRGTTFYIGPARSSRRPVSAVTRDELERAHRAMTEILATTTNRDFDEVHTEIQRGRSILAAEAVALGIIDRVVP